MYRRFKEIACESPEYEAELELRNALLRAPLGMDLYAEDLSIEKAARHFGVFEGDRIVGCLVIFPGDGGEVRLKQMAVAESHQGKGIGAALMLWVEQALRKSGVESICLHARDTAVAFYEKLGYEIVGEEFTEVGLTHRRMIKRLPPVVFVEACLDGDDPERAGRYADAAFRGGAGTIELCGQMEDDGLTPPLASARAARAAFGRPGLMAMIRPRAGDFHYSDEEVSEMERQIASMADVGVDGVVFGVLTENGELDADALDRLVARSREFSLQTTFHRAYDALLDPLGAIATLVDLGVDRILTSGVGWGEPGTALDGVERLNETIARARGRIEIVIGGSVSPAIAPAILERLDPWTGTIGMHAYSGVQHAGETTEEKVGALVRAARSN